MGFEKNSNNESQELDPAALQNQLDILRSQEEMINTQIAEGVAGAQQMLDFIKPQIEDLETKLELAKPTEQPAPIETPSEPAVDTEAITQTESADLSQVREQLDDMGATVEINEDPKPKASDLFMEKFEGGDISGAEAFMKEHAAELGPRSVDHLSRKLFQAFRQAQDWAKAMEMTTYSSDPMGVKGRKDVLRKEMRAAGEKFDDSTNEEGGGEKESDLESEGEIRNTKGFRDALRAGRLDDAIEWAAENHGSNEGRDDKWMDDRIREIYHIYRDNKDVAGAKKINELSPIESGKQGRIEDIERWSGQEYNKI